MKRGNAGGLGAGASLWILPRGSQSLEKTGGKTAGATRPVTGGKTAGATRPVTGGKTAGVTRSVGNTGG